MEYPMVADKKAEALNLKSQGKGIAEIGRMLGVPRSTVGGWVRQAPASEPTRVAALEMELASLRAQASRAGVTSQYQGISDQRSDWLKAEAANAERIKKSNERRNFTLDLSDESKPVAFTFISDQHISVDNVVDLQRMREDAELVAATEGCYAFLAGDAIDNHIKHRAAVLAARSQPGDQYKLFDWYLSIFAHRIACMVTGNHDYWTAQFAGVDMIELLAQQNRIAYSPFEAHVTVKMASTEYSVGMRHKYRLNSSFNQGHAPKQWHRNGERMHDIYCIGDHHDPHIEITRLHGLFRGVCRPGSYQITSAYAGMEGWNSTTPTCPTFIVFPRERRIQPYHDLREGLEVLGMYRK